jgi:hypothetical protein
VWQRDVRRLTPGLRPLSSDQGLGQSPLLAAPSLRVASGVSSVAYNLLTDAEREVIVALRVHFRLPGTGAHVAEAAGINFAFDLGPLWGSQTASGWGSEPEISGRASIGV